MKIGKRFLSLVADITLVCSLLLFCYICYQRMQSDTPPVVFGWSFAHVVSGSMEPAIPVGSMIAVQEQNTYQVGEIIMYRHQNGRSVTHRVVAVDGDTLITQGDANNISDPPIHYDQVTGKIRWIIPGLGALVQSAPRSPLFLGLVIVLIAAIILPEKHPGKERRMSHHEA